MASSPSAHEETEEEIFASTLQPQATPPPPLPAALFVGRTATSASRGSFDSAGEDRMNADMVRMIQTDEDAEEARERGSTEAASRSRSSSDDDSDGEVEGGGGDLGLQEMILRLMLHSAEAGAPLEPDLEEDLRGLVGSNLYNQIFEQAAAGKAEPGGGGGGGGRATAPPIRTGVVRRRSSGSGEGSSIGGVDDMPFQLVAALAGLQLPGLQVQPPSPILMAGEGGGGPQPASRKGSMEQQPSHREEDDIQLKPMPEPKDKAAGVGGAVEEDEWVNDADPGYHTLRITEQTFFDLEEVRPHPPTHLLTHPLNPPAYAKPQAALERGNEALIARRRKHEKEKKAWQAKEAEASSLMEDDLAEVEKLLKEQGPAPTYPLPLDVLEGEGEGGEEEGSGLPGLKVVEEKEEEDGGRHGIGEAVRAAARRGRGGGMDDSSHGSGSDAGSALEKSDGQEEEEEEDDDDAYKDVPMLGEDGEEDGEEEGEEARLLRQELAGPETLASFNLKIIYEPCKVRRFPIHPPTYPPSLHTHTLLTTTQTGFEEHKDMVPVIGSVLAGRYRVRDLLGQAVFSTAVECVDLESVGKEGGEEPVHVCLKIIKNNKGR